MNNSDADWINWKEKKIRDELNEFREVLGELKAELVNLSRSLSNLREQMRPYLDK